ncbi:MAG: type 2 isopentenyl-diphosphate Delta-isomerase [Candidatus Marsarchaeota archaeon]|nr:type 2 isopentenyl-diphosphate Delta-isomerase [Candidatus Marsarchaeota archaeon]
MPDEPIETQKRKVEHIDIVLNKDTQYRNKTTMLEYIEVIPKGKRINIDDVDTSMELIGKRISAPLFISGMTGGPAATLEINKNIAIGASRAGIPMGLGSQRAMLEDPNLKFTYEVKKFADLILIGNIGAEKLRKYTDDRIQEMLDDVKADMLAIHTNPGQESVQPEGNVDFKGAYERICEVAKSVRQPTLLKEVGNGISKEVAKRFEGKIYGIDVQGAGGTTWIGVETYRSKGAYGKAFWDWGIPTALSVLEVKSVFSGHVWASGGIRSASDVLKSVALGADMCGIAKPALVSQNKGGADEVYRFISSIAEGLRDSMAQLGFSSIDELRKAKIRLNGPLAKLAEQRELTIKNLA